MDSTTAVPPAPVRPLVEVLTELARARAKYAQLQARTAELRALFELSHADVLMEASLAKAEVETLEQLARTSGIEAIVCGVPLEKGMTAKRESVLTITDREKLEAWLHERQLCISTKTVVDEDALLALLKTNALKCPYALVDMIPKATIAKDLTKFYPTQES